MTQIQQTGVMVGCEVTAQGTPDTTVAVAAGSIVYQNQQATVTAGNVTPAAADALHDRIDAIVSDPTGTLSSITGTPADDTNPLQPPDTTGYILLAYIRIWNVTSPNYTATITSSAIGTPVNLLPVPADVITMTFLSGAQTNTDPGTNNFGFDAATYAAPIQHAYINYGSHSFNTSIKDFLSLGNNPSLALGYYLRLWSRSQPQRWILLDVTAFTNHTTYCDLTCTIVAAFGAFAAPPLLTTTSDTILEFVAPIASTTPTGTLISIRNLTAGTTTYTPTAGTKTIYVECWAGGGAGGGATATGNSNCSGGGGGGGGAYSASLITTVDPGAHTIAVGAGGTAGTAGNHPGNDGSDTSYTKTGTDTGTAPLAKGGTGGGGDTTNSAIGTGGEGSPGGASASGTGDITTDGAPGTYALILAATNITSGTGGASSIGGGGIYLHDKGGSNLATNGNPGGLQGGGGSGGIAVRLTSTQSSTGGAGGDGHMRIYEYT